MTAPRPVSRRNDDHLIEHLAWLRLRGLRPNTIIKRRQAIRRLALTLGTNPLRTSSDDMDTWQRGLVISATSRCCEITHIQQYFRWAKRQGLIRVDPSVKLVRPRQPHRVPRPIPEDQLQIALENAPSYLRAQLVLAAWCGLRAGEIALLQRDHILDRADPPVLVVADGKGGRQRVIPLGDRVIAELHAHGLPTRGHVFPRLDGKPGGNTPTRVSHLANEYLHEIGITATLHQLRHRAGTVWYRESQDLRLVQELLGHSAPTTTALYCAYSPAGAIAAVRAVDGSLPDRLRGRPPKETGPVLAAVPAVELIGEVPAAWLRDPEPEVDPQSSPEALERVGAALAAKAARTAARSALLTLPTAREVEILQLVADGLTNSAIAARLGLSPLTVKSHLARISKRIGCGSRTQMVVFAMTHGLLARPTGVPAGAPYVVEL